MAALTELARIVEALLFLSPDPVSLEDLAESADCDADQLAAALAELDSEYTPGTHGLALKRVAGGIALATDPIAEESARRLLARPRTPPLTPAQAETLAIVAYLQPISRPDIARIRGVSVDAAVSNLLDRGFVEEAGRSDTGAVLFRTTPLFERAFGLPSLGSLPEIQGFAPSDEQVAALREQLEAMASARVD